MSNTKQLSHYIDGEWVAARGGKSFDVQNPATGETVGQVADGGRADAKAAIDAAARAFPAWSGLTAYERSAHLYRAWQIMMERK